MVNALVQYGSGQSSSNDRRASPTLWGAAGGCPWDAIQSGAVDGVTFFDDFVDPAFTVPTTEANYGRYKGFTSTGGTILATTPEFGGIIQLSSDGDDEGASIATVGLPFKVNRNNGKLWFEARWKVASIADTKSDVFIGLTEQMTMTATVPITATTPVLADINIFGFQRLGTDGDYVNVKSKADGQTVVTHIEDAQVLVADTYVKTGFVFDPTTYLITYYFNGVPHATTTTVTATAGTTFPNDVMMGFSAAVLNAAATGGLFTIDWVRICQLGV